MREKKGHTVKKWERVMRNSEVLKFYDREEKRFLLNEINPQSVVLDIGCGYGRNIDYLIKNSKEIVGVDFDKWAVEECKRKYKNCKILLQDARNLKLKDNYFDYVICVGSTFSNIEDGDRLKILEQMYRVLKNNATAFISVWNNSKKTMNIRKKMLKENDIEIVDVNVDKIILHDSFSENFSRTTLQNLFKKTSFNKIKIKNLTDHFYICELRK